MKITVLIARYLLALGFVVFELNGFLHFIKAPPPSSDLPRQFFTVMVSSHYMVPVFVIQVVAGLLFILHRTVPLALTLIAPVIVNILIYHTTMDPAGIVPGAVLAVLWLVVFLRYRRAFDGIIYGIDSSEPVVRGHAVRSPRS